jgi:glycosyltransferase involved in cell wall biosynthesis
MTCDAPVISVIVPTYNAADTLVRCLDSVLVQDYPSIELIVIDGRSGDGTIEIIESYADRLTYWESSLDTGVFHATNKGIERATGDWIYCLGSDDYLWRADIFTQTAPHLVRAYPDHTIVQAKVALLDTNSKFVKVLGELTWEEMRQRPHTTWLFYSQGVFVRRQAFEERGYFDENFKFCGDYDINIREALHGGVANVDLVVAGFGRGGLSTNPGVFFKKRVEHRRIWAKNGLSKVKEYGGGSYLMFAVYHVVRPFLGVSRAIDVAHGAIELARKVRLDRVFGSQSMINSPRK